MGAKERNPKNVGIKKVSKNNILLLGNLNFKRNRLMYLNEKKIKIPNNKGSNNNN